jgi:hypothetical protein
MKLSSAFQRLAAALLLLFAASVTARAQVEAPVHQFLNAFNAGDNAKALAAHSSAGISITDEFAPFLWEGPKAFTEWAAGLDTFSKAHGISDPAVSLGPVDVKTVSATHAYLVYPAVYTYKQKGISTREPARMAFVVKKEGTTWKIVSWTWTGTNPQPVK